METQYILHLVLLYPVNFPFVDPSVNTNEAIVGIDAIDLETTKVFPPAFDAGKCPNNAVFTLANSIPQS